HRAGPRGGFGAGHRPGGAAAALSHRRGPARDGADAGGSPRRRMTSHPFGTGWRFGPASAGSDRPEFNDGRLAEVTLPHRVVPLSWRDWDPSAWDGVWMYRKRFDAPRGAEHGRVFLDFAAAMTHATVTLNGAEVADHLGGYLPFAVELTGLLRPRGNVLAV